MASPLTALRITKLHKTFGTTEAIRRVDLSIGTSEVVALLGPNGAGKSTLIDCALGLTRPTSGNVTLLGGKPLDAIRTGRVGAMLQGGALLPTLSVRSCVELVAATHRSPLDVSVALERAGCSHIARSKIATLSGGETQRVRFAVALISNPELLFLDEPTAAMDVEARQRFWLSMRDFTAQGRTVVFATHYLDEADSYADRVVMLSQGRIVADGTPAEVKSIIRGRRIRTTFDGEWTPEVEAALVGLPGVRTLSYRAGTLEMASDDSDATLRALLAQRTDIHNIEVTAHSMDEAFLALTTTEPQEERA